MRLARPANASNSQRLDAAIQQHGRRHQDAARWMRRPDCAQSGCSLSSKVYCCCAQPSHALLLPQFAMQVVGSSGDGYLSLPSNAARHAAQRTQQQRLHGGHAKRRWEALQTLLVGAKAGLSAFLGLLLSSKVFYCCCAHTSLTPCRSPRPHLLRQVSPGVSLRRAASSDGEGWPCPAMRIAQVSHAKSTAAAPTPLTPCHPSPRPHLSRHVSPGVSLRRAASSRVLDTRPAVGPPEAWAGRTRRVAASAASWAPAGAAAAADAWGLLASSSMLWLGGLWG
jgi:hypothetical protein